jgi:hypothetical protein
VAVLPPEPSKTFLVTSKRALRAKSMAVNVLSSLPRIFKRSASQVKYLGFHVAQDESPENFWNMLKAWRHGEEEE